LLPEREHRTRQKTLLLIPAILAVGAFRLCRIGSLVKIIFFILEQPRLLILKNHFILC